MKTLFKSKLNLAVFIALIIEFVIALAVSFRNFNDTYLWYDESGQFWIAKGLNHDSDPYSKVGNLMDVIENNQYYNMDPGGFGIIAHYWTMISNDIVWLRLLPFIFFVGVIILFYKISLNYMADKKVALLAMFIPLFFPIMINMAFEFRAYSMEVLGTFLLVFGIDKIKHELSLKNVCIYGLVSSIFMTSRYAALTVTAACSLYLLYLIFQSKNTFKQKVILSFAYGFPVLISVALIYVFALSHQNSDLEQLQYLQYLNNNPSVLLQPVNLCYLLLLLSITPFLLVKKLREKTLKYRTLIAICVILHVLYLSISLIGIYPWRVGSKSNLSINLLLLFTLFIVAIDYIQSKEWMSSFSLAAVVIIAVDTVYGYNRFLYPKHDYSIYPAQDMHINTHYDFNQIENSKHHKIFVESWEAPFIRYDYEYGKHKTNEHHFYPDRFVLQKGIPHPHFTKPESLESYQKRIPKMDQLKGIDCIISSELYDWSKHDHTKWHKVSGCDNLWELNEN